MKNPPAWTGGHCAIKTFSLSSKPLFLARILHAPRMSPFDIAAFAMPISFIVTTNLLN